jgi:hypothetical protein
VIEAVLATFRVGWDESQQPEYYKEIPATSPQDAAEKWISDHGNTNRANLGRVHLQTFLDPSDLVAVVCPDGTTKRFGMSARIVWAVKEVQGD